MRYRKRIALGSTIERTIYFKKSRITWWQDFCCKLMFERSSGDCGTEGSLRIGLLFVYIIISFPIPKWMQSTYKTKASWKNNEEIELWEAREYGFYFYDWAFVWHWHAKTMESSSSDPWWMRQYIHIDAIFVGKWEIVHDRIDKGHELWFAIGKREFKLDSIKLVKNKRFRTYIPMALYCQEYYSMDVEIKDPPMRAGKGENSWDCGDDGSYGLYCPYAGPKPTWKNRQECFEWAAKKYYDSYVENLDKYGNAHKEKNVDKSDLTFKYIGYKNQETGGSCEAQATSVS